MVSNTIGRLARTLVGQFLRLTTGMVRQEGVGTSWKSSTYADVLERLKTHTAFGDLVCNFSRILRHYCYNTMATIGEHALKGLDSSPSLANTPKSQQMKFSLDWDPRAFLQDQYEAGVEEELRRVITITGNSCDAQMATVEQYMSQTWSLLGDSLLLALRSAVRSEKRLLFHRGMFVIQQAFSAIC